MRRARRLAPLMLLVAFLLCLLSACGGTSSPTPTPKPNPKPQPTVAPGATLGQLTDQMRQAWSGLKSYRSVLTTTQNLVAVQALLPGLDRQLLPPASGTPLTGKSLVSLQVTDEVMLPDRKDRLILVNNQPMLELLAIGDHLYSRRYTASEGTLPAAGAWTAIDQAHLATTDPMFTMVASFKAVGSPPGTGEQGTERSLLLHPGSSVQVGSRICQNYQVVTTTVTGEKVEVSISVGADHLPCTIVTTAGGTQSETDYSGYNEAMPLPASPASPVASPGASPSASPGASPVVSPIATPVAAH